MSCRLSHYGMLVVSCNPCRTAATTAEGDGNVVEVGNHVNDAVAAKDEVHKGRYVGHVDFSVAVHVAQAGVCMVVCPEGIDVHRTVGKLERVVGSKVEDGPVALLADVQWGVLSFEGNIILEQIGQPICELSIIFR